MKQTFTPAICIATEGLLADYEGTVTLRMPSYDERLSLYEESGFDFSDESEDVALKTKRRIQMLRVVAKRAQDFVCTVDIRRKSDGFHMNHWEHLWFDSDMAAVVQEIAMKLIGKFAVGNPQ